MLYQRILTAAVALPIAVAAILLLPTPGIAVLVAVLMLIGAWEWATLMGLARAGRIGLLATVGLCLVVLAGIASFDPRAHVPLALIALAGLFWLAVVAQLARFPAGWQLTLGRLPIAFVVGCIVLCAPVVSVVVIRDEPQGAALVLLLCVMVWGADTGAYFVGRGLGRHKLIVNVSPGKTVEGAAGGVLFSMAVGALGAFILGLPSLRILAFTLLGAWIALISIVGDLTISMFKRSAGAKDSGALFPGHGGVLDRLDSLTAAAPWFVLGLLLMR